MKIIHHRIRSTSYQRGASCIPNHFCVFSLVLTFQKFVTPILLCTPKFDTYGVQYRVMICIYKPFDVEQKEKFTAFNDLFLNHLIYRRNRNEPVVEQK